MPRDEFFAALFIIGCANGLGARVIDTVRWVGWADAARSTFGTSAIGWIACYAGIRLILEPATEKLDADKIQTADLVVGLALLIPIALPSGALSWFAISALGLYLILVSHPLSARRRGAIILFDATVPMLCRCFRFRFFANFCRCFCA